MPILVSGAPVDTGVIEDVSAAWHGVKTSWRGADGSEWDLTSPDSGAVLADSGVLGLGMPEFQRYSTSGPVVPGSRWRGYRINDRAVTWNVYVLGGSSAEFVQHDRAWWRSLRPDVPGVWRVELPDGSWRELTCRLDDDGAWAPGIDPVLTGWALYQVALVADDDPLWRGPTIEQTFTGGGVSNWLGGAGVMTISPSQTLADATLTNPGDVPAWPRWTVTGPCDSATLGVGGGSVVYNAPIAAGHHVVIDTSPRVLSAVTDAGLDVSGQVTWAARPVPAGENVPVTATLAALGSGARLDVAIDPAYFRAW